MLKAKFLQTFSNGTGIDSLCFIVPAKPNEEYPHAFFDQESADKIEKLYKRIKSGELEIHNKSIINYNDKFKSYSIYMTKSQTCKDEIPNKFAVCDLDVYIYTKPSKDRTYLNIVVNKITPKGKIEGVTKVEF